MQVGVEPLAGEVMVRVTDTGSGIAAEDLPHVFERFYRADQARGAGEPRSGSGIGLTIARELLAANGGRIAVERSGPERDDLRDRAAARGLGPGQLPAALARQRQPVGAQDRHQVDVVVGSAVEARAAQDASVWKPAFSYD